QSAPKIIIQILVIGAQIFGKAIVAAGRQAVQNAKHRPQGVAGDAAGVGHATTGSLTDRLTREHRMTLDEAHLILNLKRGEPVENVLRNYEHLFKANSSPPPPETPSTGTGRQATPRFYSHYLQSKVVSAHARIEAELKIPEMEEMVPDPPGSTPKPPGSEGGGTPPPTSGSS
ncbi:hypothetical protein BD410DRAFT_716659, partial [Rickenella mellea]